MDRWPTVDNFCSTCGKFWCFRYVLNSLRFHLFSFIMPRLFSYILILLFSSESIDNWQYIVDDGYFLLSCSHCLHNKINYTSDSTPQSGKIYTQRLLEAMKIEAKNTTYYSHTHREKEQRYTSEPTFVIYPHNVQTSPLCKYKTMKM